MKIHALFVLIAALLVPDGIPEDPVKNELESMQGTWVVIGCEYDGRKYSSQEIQGQKLDIKGNEMIVDRDSGRPECRFLVDPTKMPKEITVTPLGDGVEGNPFKGIYSIENNILKICCGPRESKLPTKFETKAGDRSLLWISKREEARP